ncbi:hypothetical protein CBW65_21665 [Tumebacillus avium]|uniref:Uncharacterized protein n=1 Tax=Tumebacillus avium TaxID=1903704 RepID=A0A1Y0ITI6_9BACL|nr:hypothetical protein [Tumebacillus avium]ARU63299.1 hypothetical protein CBW65_21665 [Tumebacillus avium]
MRKGNSKTPFDPMFHEFVIWGCALLLFLAAFLLSLPDEREREAQQEKAAPSAPGLFALLYDLTGTTGSMLEHTEQLHQKVQGVESKLAQLEEQERILARQQETGERLGQELSRQVKLTEQGVTLMAEILEGEQESVQLTSQVTVKVSSLTQDVGQNAALLDRLADPLARAGQESAGLSGQLDLLLAELNRSRETFKYFGKLKDLLDDPLHPLPLLPLPRPLPPLPDLFP